MAGLAESLVTRGMICLPFQEDAIISFDTPTITETLEVRPRIRSVTGDPPPGTLVPVMTSSQELKPIMKGAKAPAPSNPDPKPVPTSTIELKPIMKSAKEE